MYYKYVKYSISNFLILTLDKNQLSINPANNFILTLICLIINFVYASYIIKI